MAFFSAGATAQKLLAKFFTQEMGFGTIVHVDNTDGIQVLFDNGDVAHVRPSGNADELRIYTVADTQVRADAIAAMGVVEPNGILRLARYPLRAGVCAERAVGPGAGGLAVTPPPPDSRARAKAGLGGAARAPLLVSPARRCAAGTRAGAAIK